MKAINFKESNKTYAKKQPEYFPIDVLDDDSQVISCWKLSFFERVRVLFIGKVWLSLLMFGKPLTPIKMTTKKKNYIN